MSDTFRTMMEKEMTSVRSRGHCCKSWHEGYGLMLEEVDEFWDEVKKRPKARDRVNALRELVQIATLCERIAIDLALVDDYEKKQQAAEDQLLREVGFEPGEFR